jgi:AraC-like DNA-binding protein
MSKTSGVGTGRPKPPAMRVSELSCDNLIPSVDYVVNRRCTPAWRLFPHEFNACDLTYCISGNARYTIDGVDYDLAAGDLLCLPRGVVRAAETFPDRLMHCFSVNFHLTDLKGRLVRLPFPIVNHPGIKKDLCNMFYRLATVWLEKERGYSIEVRGIFLLILHRFFEILVFEMDARNVDYRISKAQAFIAGHYFEKCSVGKIARMFNLNAHYFGNLFKKETGVSLNRYLMRTRCKNAQNMLISGEYKVEDIPEACGFTDTGHLYKCFKEIVGLAPSQFLPQNTLIVDR